MRLHTVSSVVVSLIPVVLLASPARSQVIKDWTYSPGLTRVVADSDGSIYTTRGTHLIKLDLDGNLVWEKEIDQLGGGRSIANWMAMDPFGNVILAGGSSAYANKFLVQKWDSDGNILWETITPDTSNAFRVATDATGNAYVVGETPSSLPAFVVAKYDPSGAELWVRVFAGGAINHPFSMDVTPGGDVAVTGESNIPGNLYDIATVVYASDGTKRWEAYRTSTEANGGQDAGAGVAFGPNGEVYVCGWIEKDATGPDLVVLKYDSTGNELWMQSYTTAGYQYDVGLWAAVDGQGNVVVAGQSAGDLLARKYDPDGNLLWERRNDGGYGGSNYLLHMIVGPDDSVYLTGSNGVGEMLAAKYDDNGNLIWTTHESPSSFPVYGWAIATDSGNGTLVATSWGLIRYLDPTAIYQCQGVEDEDVLTVNGDNGNASGHEVQVSANGPIQLAIDLPSGGGRGKFFVHLNVGEPTTDTIVDLGFGLGPVCHEVLLPSGATPVAVYNNIGKIQRIGSSNYFGTPIPDPQRAPTTFLDLASGDPAVLPVGSVFTIQGVILNPASSSPKRASVTNGIIMRVMN